MAQTYGDDYEYRAVQQTEDHVTVYNVEKADSEWLQSTSFVEIEQ